MMMEQKLFDLIIPGPISTKSSSTHEDWSKDLESKLHSIPSSTTHGRWLSIEIKVWISNKRIHRIGRMDVDNIAKITLDSITHSGLIRDDSLVHDLHVTKYPTDGPEEMMLSAKEWIL